MSIEEKRNLFLRLDQMISMKVPGKAEELAGRLNVSRSTFFRCLEEMRMMGAPIEFDEQRRRYKYTEEGRFRFGFLSRSDKQMIGGGYQLAMSKYFFASLNF